MIHRREDKMEQILNFRKLADGIVNSDGKKIKNIYRSADVSRASNIDIEQLNQAKIENIIDLRNDDEICRHPLLDHQSIIIKNIQIIKSARQNDMKDIDLSNAMQFMTDLYANEFVTTDGFKQELEYILSLDGAPFLFHCTAGKDRTGITGLLLMHILGFDYDQIKDEYLTIDQQLITAITMMMKSAMGEMVNQVDDQQLRQIAGVHIDFINSFYMGVTERYGTLDNYFEQKLGIGEEQVNKLKANYLE